MSKVEEISGPIRNCLRCGREIRQCMGGMLARDILLAQDGKIEWSQVREHCGQCVLQLTTALDGSEIDSMPYLRSIPDLI